MSATQSGGDTTLLVTDTTQGTHEQITLGGNETAAAGYIWTASADGNGGASVVDPSQNQTTTIDAGGELNLTIASNQTVIFSNASGYGALVLSDPEGFTGQIVGFTGTAPDAAHSDTIDLVGINYNSAQFVETYNSSTGLLTVTDGAHAASITFDNFNATLDFTSDGNGGTLITDPTGQ